jgi:dolichol kinase
LIGFRRNVQPFPATNELSSLAYRRKQMRRRRHDLSHGIASVAGWGFLLLATGWLLLAGVFGLLRA